MDWSYRGATFEQDTLERVRELLDKDRGSDSGLKKAKYIKLAQWLIDCLHKKGAPNEWEVAWKQVKSKLTSIYYPCPCLIIFWLIKASKQVSRRFRPSKPIRLGLDQRY
jgi:hypothetical protein